MLNAVFGIPNNLRKLLGEGALSSAFIPVLSRVQHEHPAETSDQPREIARNLLSLQYLVLVPLLVLAAVFARPITDTILRFDEAWKQQLSAELFRWFIHYTLLISVSAVLVGVLNSCSRFVIPATTPILFSVCVITSVLVFHNSLGLHSMSLGILMGGLAQVLFQLPQFRRLGFDLKPSFAFSNPHFRQILRRWAPVIASSSVFAINQQIAVFFASGLDDGSSSALANAVVFWQLPQGVFGVSVMTVLFPRMSREAGTRDLTALRRTVGLGLRHNIALLVPSSIILALFGPEIIAVAFQRGNFLDWNTLMASRVLAGYCVGMLGVVVFAFLQRFHYAWGDYRTPTWSAVVVLVINVSLSYVLKETTLRVAGLSLANSVGFSVGTIILAVNSRRILGGLELRTIGRVALRTILATSPAIAGLTLLRTFWGSWWSMGSTFGNLLRLLGSGTLVVGVTVAMYVLLRMEVVDLVRRRRR